MVARPRSHPAGECVAEAIALTGVRVEHQVIMPNHVHLLLTLERAATRPPYQGPGRRPPQGLSCRRPNASSRKDCPHRSRDAGRHKNCPADGQTRVAKDCPHRSRDAGRHKNCPADGQTRVATRIVPTGAGTQADARVAPTDSGPRAAAELGRLVGTVKSRSVHLAAGRGLEAGRLWQRGYYDHIVRSENDFLRIWTYIDNNPLRWELDCYYTER